MIRLSRWVLIAVSIPIAAAVVTALSMLISYVLGVNALDTLGALIYVLPWTPLLIGWCLDRCYGDPHRLHPIVGLGHLIGWGDRKFNHGTPLGKRLRGMLYNGLLILVCFFGAWAIDLGIVYSITTTNSVTVAIGLSLVMVWYHGLGAFYMLSGRTLIDEVRGVFDALSRSLEDGRRQVSRIVGRDTTCLSEQEVRTAALETLSENLSDGVVAPMFWFSLLGLPGMMTYKMINTQDSMIGYRTDRHRDYGCFSARMDDVANYLPARLTAWLMLLVSGRLDLLGFVRRYGRQHASPNAGYPESALAGLLDCRFGGTHDYFGQPVYKPYIGHTDRPLGYRDLIVAVRVNRRVEIAMLALTLVIRIFVLGTLLSCISLS